MTALTPRGDSPSAPTTTGRALGTPAPSARVRPHACLQTGAMPQLTTAVAMPTDRETTTATTNAANPATNQGNAPITGPQLRRIALGTVTFAAAQVALTGIFGPEIATALATVMGMAVSIASDAQAMIASRIAGFVDEARKVAEKSSWKRALGAVSLFAGACAVTHAVLPMLGFSYATAVHVASQAFGKLSTIISPLCMCATGFLGARLLGGFMASKMLPEYKLVGDKLASLVTERDNAAQKKSWLNPSRWMHALHHSKANVVRSAQERLDEIGERAGNEQAEKTFVNATSRGLKEIAKLAVHPIVIACSADAVLSSIAKAMATLSDTNKSVLTELKNSISFSLETGGAVGLIVAGTGVALVGAYYGFEKLAKTEFGRRSGAWVAHVAHRINERFFIDHTKDSGPSRWNRAAIKVNSFLERHGLRADPVEVEGEERVPLAMSLISAPCKLFAVWSLTTYTAQAAIMGALNGGLAIYNTGKNAFNLPDLFGSVVAPDGPLIAAQLLASLVITPLVLINAERFWNRGRVQG
jgi:hypothetical protein